VISEPISPLKAFAASGASSMNKSVAVYFFH
jgi:hypothetical protein